LSTPTSPRDESWAKKGSKPCVLIVMHNTTERLLLKHVCQLEGCVVHASETGLKALELLAANAGTYVLCLIDTVLPDIEPHSLCSQMSELARGGARRDGKLKSHLILCVSCLQPVNLSTTREPVFNP
jgi:CheY-like chemotaxis protein